MKNPSLREFDIRTFLAEEGIDWKDTDFYISKERSFLIMPSQALRTNFYIVAFCTKGSARIKLNLEQHLAESNTVLSVTPHHIFQIVEHSPDLNLRIVFFTRSFLFNNQLNTHVLDNLGFFKPNNFSLLNVNEEDAASLLNLFKLIREKSEKGYYYRREIVRHLLISLLYEIDALYQHHSNDFTSKLSRKEDLTRRYHDLVMQHYKEEHGVKFYADALFVTPKYLTEVIKEVTGKPAGHIVDEMIVLEAKVLLKMPELSIMQVCQMLNFTDQSTFGKFFKRVSGQSPSEYRDQQ